MIVAQCCNINNCPSVPPAGSGLIKSKLASWETAGHSEESYATFAANLRPGSKAVSLHRSYAASGKGVSYRFVVQLK